MKKKLDLTLATPSKEQSYGEWTKNYRQSTKVYDRRKPDPTTTPADKYADTGFPEESQNTPSQSSSTTRKVSPEEAVNATHNRRK